MIYNLVRNDTRPILRFTCKDDDGSVIDLTSATKVYFTFKKSGATEKKFKKECSVVNPPTSGIATYSWGATDLAETGYFEGEIEIVFNDGTKQTTADKIGFNVREDLDNA